MTNANKEFRQQLLDMQPLSPTLRAGYEDQLNLLINPPLTKRTAAVGITLAIFLLAMVVLIIRTDIVHQIRGLMLAGHAMLALGFLAASFLILRDLRRWKHSPRSVYSIAGILTWTAGALTVVALIMGLSAPSDPKSTFGAFYVFVFYFACAVWGLETRIGNAELAAKEQSLRIECRLADIADRMR